MRLGMGSIRVCSLRHFAQDVAAQSISVSIGGANNDSLVFHHDSPAMGFAPAGVDPTQLNGFGLETETSLTKLWSHVQADYGAVIQLANTDISGTHGEDTTTIVQNLDHRLGGFISEWPSLRMAA